MNDQTLQLIEKLAAKLGTAGEHLWNVLVTQAPISGTVDLVICIVLVIISWLLALFVGNKTKTKVWQDEIAVLAWLGVVCMVLLTLLILIISATNIAAAFLNPEYWALKQIIK